MYTYKCVQTAKELHGWYVVKNRRECTAERLLINPYNGCSVGCFFCYARALPGNFELFHKENTIFVFENFPEVVEQQIQNLNVASCGYLSPVTDPFQEIESQFQLSKKIIEVFLKYNIPIEFITKCKIPDEIIQLIKISDSDDKNTCKKHCFAQVSVLTTNENLRKILVPNGASVDILFNNFKRLAENNIFSVCRIDPILPYITDKKEDLKEIVFRAKDNGVKHIIASVMDIPLKIYDYVMQKIKEYFGTSVYYDYKKLYIEKIGYLNAKLDYRMKIFDFLRNLCDKANLTFALCMEYRIVDEDTYEGLNKIFMSSTNCEGIDIPIYVRKPTEKKFRAVDSCDGACLNCVENKCGIEGLAQGKSYPKGFKLKDYKRFSEKFVESFTMKLL